MRSTVSIVDFGIGNVGSLCKKLHLVDASPVLASTPAEVRAADRLVLPGVGCFASAAAKLTRNGMRDALTEAVLIRQRPVLGICLGIQLMAGWSEEGGAEGLGWIRARSARLRLEDRCRLKVPQIGWNTLDMTRGSRLLRGTSPQDEFYFSHAYHLADVDDSSVCATTEYGYTFAAAIEVANIFGTQFHPEKSHSAGAEILKNFVRI